MLIANSWVSNSSATSPLHSVRVEYDPHLDRRPVETRVVACVARALRETDGDVLVFLPGVGEIQAVARALSGRAKGVAVTPLHGRLSAAEQDAAISPGAERKIVLSTNLAES